ncbi:hypothetical protein ACFWN1_07930 [Streptomyces sp. NPDC058459]|uniref:hypothetical protein n=1 Tax=Streptomyces sp. NPDC058459 TaxID=3346508 RepID=UPI003653C66B
MRGVLWRRALHSTRVRPTWGVGWRGQASYDGGADEAAVEGLTTAVQKCAGGFRATIGFV